MNRDIVKKVMLIQSYESTIDRSSYLVICQYLDGADHILVPFLDIDFLSTIIQMCVRIEMKGCRQSSKMR